MRTIKINHPIASGKLYFQAIKDNIEVTSYRNGSDTSEQSFFINGKPYRIGFITWKCPETGILNFGWPDIVSLTGFSNQRSRYRELIISIVSPLIKELAKDKVFMKQGRIASLRSDIRSTNRQIKRYSEILNNHKNELKKQKAELAAL